MSTYLNGTAFTDDVMREISEMVEKFVATPKQDVDVLILNERAYRAIEKRLQGTPASFKPRPWQTIAGIQFEVIDDPLEMLDRARQLNKHGKKVGYCRI